MILTLIEDKQAGGWQTTGSTGEHRSSVRPSCHQDLSFIIKHSTAEPEYTS